MSDPVRPISGVIAHPLSHSRNIGQAWVPQLHLFPELREHIEQLVVMLLDQGRAPPADVVEQGTEEIANTRPWPSLREVAAEQPCRRTLGGRRGQDLADGDLPLCTGRPRWKKHCARMLQKTFYRSLICH